MYFNMYDGNEFIMGERKGHLKFRFSKTENESKNSEKCPSWVPTAQGDVVKFCTIQSYIQWFRDIQFTGMKNWEKAANLHICETGTSDFWGIFAWKNAADSFSEHWLTGESAKRSSSSVDFWKACTHFNLSTNQQHSFSSVTAWQLKEKEEKKKNHDSIVSISGFHWRTTHILTLNPSTSSKLLIILL